VLFALRPFDPSPVLGMDGSYYTTVEGRIEDGRYIIYLEREGVPVPGSVAEAGSEVALAGLSAGGDVGDYRMSIGTNGLVGGPDARCIITIARTAPGDPEIEVWFDHTGHMRIAGSGRRWD